MKLKALKMLRNQAKPDRDRMSFSDNIVILTISTLLLSPFGWSLFLNFSGNYIPEPAIFIITIYILFSKGEFSKAIRDGLRSTVFYVGLMFSFGLFIVGVSLHGDFIAAYSDLRVFIIFFVFYSLIYADSSHTLRIRIIICIAIFYLASAENIVAYLTLPGNGTVKNVYPIFFPIFCIVSAEMILKPSLKKDFITYSSVAMLCFMAITSFYRLYYFLAIVFSAIPIAQSLGSLLSKDSSLSKKFSSLVIAILFIAVILSDQFQFFVYDYFTSSEERYIQSIGKLNDIADAFVGGNSQGDESRILYYQTIWENFTAFCLPSGLGQKVLEGGWGSLWSDVRLIGDSFSSKDGGFIYMVTHFGILITFYIFFLAIKIAGFQLVSISPNKKILLLLIVGLIFTYTVTAAMFVQVAFASGFASCLGIVFSWNRWAAALQLENEGTA